MPLFDQNAEKLRKENLKKMEDCRIRFAEKLEKMHFAPERMLFCSNESGSFSAIARMGEQLAIIVSPAFGEDGDFVLDIQDMKQLQMEREDVFEKGTGLNGAFGFGTKGAKGFRLHIIMSEGTETVLPLVAGRTSYLEVASAKKNPLLKTRRRRGNANIVWDLMPIDPGHMSKIEDLLAKYYLA